MTDALIAYDAATERMLAKDPVLGLAEDFTLGIEQNANVVMREVMWRHRVYFLDELEQQQSRLQPKPA